MQGLVDPFHELSAICVRNVRDAFWGLDHESPTVTDLATEPGGAMTISWTGPSIASLKTMNASAALCQYDVAEVLKHVSLQLQSGSFPSHTGRVVGNLPNGGFVFLQPSPDSDGNQRPICFFISKPCFISLNEFGIALISVPHECITSLLPTGASIVPLTLCIIARKVSGRLEFNVSAELGVHSGTDKRPFLDELHSRFVPLASLLNDLQASCATNAPFTQDLSRGKAQYARTQVLQSVLRIVLPHLKLQSRMHLLAVSKHCRKIAVDYFRDASSCDAIDTHVAPSRLNYLLQMHEQITHLTLNVGKNNYSFDRILQCSSTLVNLTVLHLHNLQAMADADIAHVLRACKQLRTVELNNATHAGTLSLVALASSCCHLRRIQISASHASIVNELLVRELACTCFSAPLQAFEIPMCFRYSLTAMRHITTVFGGALFAALDLSGCVHLGDAGICSIVNLCVRIETFIAKFSPASDATCQALSKCSNLSSLDLSGSLPSRKGLMALAPLAPSLRRLSLSRCTAVNDSNLCELLRLLPNMNFIDVIGCPAISFSTIMLLKKLALHADIKHSMENYVALENAAQVASFIQPISERAALAK